RTPSEPAINTSTKLSTTIVTSARSTGSSPITRSDPRLTTCPGYKFVSPSRRARSSSFGVHSRTPAREWRHPRAWLKQRRDRQTRVRLAAGASGLAGVRRDPGRVRRHVTNLDFVIEAEPPPGEKWLASYEGTPLTHQTSRQPGWPSKITFYSG